MCPLYTDTSILTTTILYIESKLDIVMIKIDLVSYYHREVTKEQHGRVPQLHLTLKTWTKSFQQFRQTCCAYESLRSPDLAIFVLTCVATLFMQIFNYYSFPKKWTIIRNFISLVLKL